MDKEIDRSVWLFERLALSITRQVCDDKAMGLVAGPSLGLPLRNKSRGWHGDTCIILMGRFLSHLPITTERYFSIAMITGAKNVGMY